MNIHHMKLKNYWIDKIEERKILQTPVTNQELEEALYEYQDPNQKNLTQAMGKLGMVFHRMAYSVIEYFNDNKEKIENKSEIRQKLVFNCFQKISKYKNKKYKPFNFFASIIYFKLLKLVK